MCRRRRKSRSSLRSPPGSHPRKRRNKTPSCGERSDRAGAPWRHAIPPLPAPRGSRDLPRIPACGAPRPARPGRRRNDRPGGRDPRPCERPPPAPRPRMRSRGCSRCGAPRCRHIPAGSWSRSETGCSTPRSQAATRRRCCTIRARARRSDRSRSHRNRCGPAHPRSWPSPFRRLVARHPPSRYSAAVHRRGAFGMATIASAPARRRCRASSVAFRRCEFDRSPHLAMTTCRYSLGTTMVPSSALFMRAMRACRSFFRPV